MGGLILLIAVHFPSQLHFLHFLKSGQISHPPHTSPRCKKTQVHKTNKQKIQQFLLLSNQLPISIYLIKII